MEVKFAPIDGQKRALIVDCGQRHHSDLLVRIIGLSLNGAGRTHQVVDNFPHFAHVLADAHQELSVFGKAKVLDPFGMLVLHAEVVEKLVLIQLDHVEHLLRLLQQLPHLKVLQAVLTFQTSLCFRNVLLEDRHALLAFAH